MKAKDVITAASVELNREEQTQLASMESMKEQLSYIAKRLRLLK